MKKKRFVLVSIVVVLLVVAAIIIFGNTGSKPITYTYNPHETTSNSNSNDYNTYLENVKAEHGALTTPQGVNVSVAGVDYSSTSLASDSLIVYNKTDETFSKYVIEGDMIQNWISSLWQNR